MSEDQGSQTIQEFFDTRSVFFDTLRAPPFQLQVRLGQVQAWSATQPKLGKNKNDANKKT